MQLHVSDMAPPFSTLDDEGKKVSLGDYMGKTNIVLYFYPKDFTMGCTKESCTFRDRWDDIRALGAVVLGISSDGEGSHREFKKKYSLPFTLLSDPGQEIRNLYGVKGRYLPLPSRVTFVIDKDGKIRDIFNSQLNVSKHVENAVEVLKKIRDEEQQQRQTVQERSAMANSGMNHS
ncbi:MAG TPA: peroxiredoxin [Nitrososphaerales archaeon]|nr:peroxiredoxin [Nitrososphaerales archaeon]